MTTGHSLTSIPVRKINKLCPPDDTSSIVSRLYELLCGFHGAVDSSLVGLQFGLKRLVLLQLPLQVAGVLGVGGRREGVQLRPSTIPAVQCSLSSCYQHTLYVPSSAILIFSLIQFLVSSVSCKNCCRLCDSSSRERRLLACARSVLRRERI